MKKKYVVKLKVKDALEKRELSQRLTSNIFPK